MNSEYGQNSSRENSVEQRKSTEELKRKDAMLWVQRCNNIRNRAEEIVLNEMVYI